MNRSISILAFACGVAVCNTSAAGDGSPAHLEVSGGTVSFEVSTNVPGVEVKGKSNALTADVQVESSTEGLV